MWATNPSNAMTTPFARSSKPPISEPQALHNLGADISMRLSLEAKAATPFKVVSRNCSAIFNDNNGGARECRFRLRLAATASDPATLSAVSGIYSIIAKVGSRVHLVEPNCGLRPMRLNVSRNCRHFCMRRVRCASFLHLHAEAETPLSTGSK